VSTPPDAAARRPYAPCETAAGQYTQDQAAETVAQLTGPVSNHTAAMAAGRESYPVGQRGDAG
jgi:hypothetical protein